MSNTTLLLIVGVAGVGLYMLTKEKTVLSSTPAAAPNPYSSYVPPASQNPAVLNNYYPSKAQEAGAIISGIGSVLGAAASIYKTSQSSGGSSSDGLTDYSSLF